MAIALLSRSTRTSSVSALLGSERRRIVQLFVVALVGSLAAAEVVLKLDIFSVLIFGGVAVLGMLLAQPRLGVYMIVGVVILFEDGGLDPLMQPAHHLYSGIAGSIVMPVEMVLLLSLAAWVAQRTIKGERLLRGGQLKWPILLFFGAVVGGLVRGAASGGDMYFGLWESRAFLYFVLCYFLTASVIRTRRHVQNLMGIILVATGLFSIEGIYRHYALVNSGAISGPMSYSHEDAVFLGTALLLVVAQHVYGAPRWQRLLGLVVAPLAMFTLFASERRAGMIGTMVGFLAFAALFLFIHRKAFCLIALPVLIGAAIYLPLFWNNTSVLGQPARSIRSMYEPDARDASSNFARVLEKMNVRFTINENPVLGVGFGREYTWIVQLPVVESWPMQHYVSHINELWVWLKTGAAGYALFWILIGSSIAVATRAVRVLRDPPLRAYGLVALAGIIGVIVYSSVDTGLVSPRLMAVTSVLIGSVAVLEQIGANQEAPVSRRERVPAP